MSSPTYSMAWYANCSVTDRKNLQRVIKTAQKITGCPLTSPGTRPAHCVSGELKKLLLTHFTFDSKCSGTGVLKSRTAKLRNRVFFFTWAIRGH